MASGLSQLIETIVSIFVDIGGNGVKHGGKGALLAGARKIGWASGGGGQSRGRFGGHRIAGHRMGTGFGGAGRPNLNNYNPAEDHKRRAAEQYNRGMMSGSGKATPKLRATAPTNLHGRSSFEDPGSPIGRGQNSRWIRHNRGGRGGSYTPRPRSFIRF